MHLHKYEKIWLLFGIGALLVFTITIGVSAFYMGNQPPSCLVTVDPANVDKTAPFDQPGLKQVGDKQYELVVVASAFNYDVGPNKVIQVPVGSTINFIGTTKDVVHGFEVAGSNANMMLEPGYINTVEATFNKPGKYTIVCNEYCGLGHHLMFATLEVIE